VPPTLDAPPDIRLTGLVKRYGDVAAVDGIDLDVRRGEFFTLLGPSGSGKTTTLRLIAGFERPDAGTVELAGTEVSDRPPFARETISFLVVLPIALPGIVTGMALNSTFTQVLGVDLTLFTIIVGHATFCIVVVYNNVIARLRRLGGSLEEASADLGAHTWQTFRYVTFPQMRSALIAGGLLAFALSFDEVIVTTFTAGNKETLPIWILTNLSRPNQLPVVNVVGVVVILLSVIPVYFAVRIASESVSAAPR
jgi:ABC-type spermidine/putrescine transport system permease subunit II